MSLPAVDALLAIQERLGLLARGLTSPPAVSRLLELPVLTVVEDPFAGFVPTGPVPPSGPATRGRAGPGDTLREDDVQPDEVPDGALEQPGAPDTPPSRKASRTTGRAPARVAQSPRPASGLAPAPGLARAPSGTSEAAPAHDSEPTPHRACRPERAEAKETREDNEAGDAGSAASYPHPASGAHTATREARTGQIRPPSGSQTPTTVASAAAALPDPPDVPGAQAAVPGPVTIGNDPSAGAVRAGPTPAPGEPELSGENALRVIRDPARGAAVLRAHLGDAAVIGPAAPRSRPGAAALPDPPDVPGAQAAVPGLATIGNDPMTDAGIDELYAALADRLRLDVLRTYGTGEG